MKKRIMFIMPSMFIGGAERSLLGLLAEINKEAFDVSLFLYRHEGELLNLIPKDVHILSENRKYATFDVPIKSLVFSRLYIYGLARIIGKIKLNIKKGLSGERFGIWASMQYTSQSLQPLLPAIPGEYDIAVMFLGIPDTVINKVNAKKKIAWNHTDYTILYPDQKIDRKLFLNLDFVVSVSNTAKDQFLSVYPDMSTKSIVIENVLNQKMLELQAHKSCADEFREEKCIILLSVGRFSEAKNFDNVPDICKRIREMGQNIRWYLIGYGGDEEIIREKIVESRMEQYVIILGKKDNPYPYIKACDLYVQPSRYEGKCVSVREAQMLGKPVVITNYATSGSQLEDGIDGVIVPMDNEGCARGIVNLLCSPERMKSLSAACLERDYSNSSEVEKIYSLFEF